MAIRPTPEQFQTLMEGPADTPVVMVNLLTFKKEASDADAGVSGQGGVRSLRRRDAEVRGEQRRAASSGPGGSIRS